MSAKNQLNDTDEGGRLWYVFLVAFVAAAGGFLFGYDLVIIAGANNFLKDQFNLDASMMGSVTSSAGIGCIAGPFCGIWLCDRLGRKMTLFVAGILLGISALGTAAPERFVFFESWDTIQTFNVLRMIGGLGVGISSLASPMYIAEIAPARRRGALGFMYFVALVSGAAISTVVASSLADHFPKETSWRWMFGSELVPIVGLLFCLSFVPRSPRWLASRGRDQEAIDVLTGIDGRNHALREMQAIKNSLSEETGGWREVFQPGIRGMLLFGIVMGFFHNLTGWTSFAYYQDEFFRQSGWGSESASLRAMAIVMTTCIAYSIMAAMLVDRVGRRVLWNVTSAAMIFATLFGGLIFHMQVKGTIVLVVFIVCAMPHHFGLAPVPWLMMSEIFPTRIRAKAVAICTTAIWYAGWLGTRWFPVICEKSEEMIGSAAGGFWIFSVICVFSLIFGLLWMPETKGKTLEEISERWLHEKK